MSRRPKRPPETAEPRPPGELGDLLARVADNLPVALARVDGDGRVSLANKTFDDLFGPASKPSAGRTLAEVFGSSSYAQARTHVETALSGQECSFVLPLGTDDGQARQLHASFSPDRDDAGIVSGFLCLFQDRSEPARGAETLDKTKVLYERTERLAQLGHFEWDELADRCIYCSEELARLYGYSVEEYLEHFSQPQDDLQAVHPDDRERFLEAAERLLADGVEFNIEYRLLQRSGNVIQVREVAEPIYDQSGRVVRSIGYVQDISEQKAYDHALRNSEQRFKDFADASSHWLWEMGPDLRFSYISDGITKLTGEQPSYFIGKTRREIAGAVPADRGALSANLAQMERHEPFEDFLFNRPTTTGGQVYLSLSGKPVFDTQGSFAGYRGTARDITEKTRMQEAIHQSEILLRQAAEIADLGHWAWDEINDRCIYCSDSLVRMNKTSIVGYLERYGTMEGLLADVHPDDRARYEQVITGAREKHEAYEIEFRDLAGDGVYHHLRERGEPLFDEKGQHYRTVGILQDITKEREAEAALRKSEALLTQAAQIANLGHWAWDEIADKCVYCSESLAQMNGTTVEQYLADHGTMESILASIHPDDRERYHQTISRGADTKQPYEIEFRKVMPDGGYRYFLERADPMLDKQGRHLRTVGILQDITKDKEAEAALRRSESALAKAQRVAKLGHWHWTIAGDELISCSEEYARIHGVLFTQVKQHLSHQMDRVIHPDDRERVAREFDRFDAQGLDYEIEYRILLPSGEVRHVQEIGEAVFDETGRAVAHSGTLQDITERKLAEDALQRAHDELDSRVRRRTAELSLANRALKDKIAENEGTVAALRQSEEQTRLITDSLPALIVLVDRRKRYKFVNRTYEQWYQLSSDDIIGQPMVNVMGQQRYQTIRRYLERAFSGQLVTFETPIAYPDGKTRHVSGLYVPQLGEDGEVENVIGVASDITDRKRAEEELKQAQKMDAVGKLTGGIAHDFNNLLFVIQGSLVLLEHEIDANEEVKQVLDSIKTAAQLGADLTRSLLAFSRQQPLDPVPIDLGVAIAGTVRTILRTLAPEMQIKTSFTGDVWPIMIDRQQLDNAILNLALNARDAMDKAGTLWITAENAELEGNPKETGEARQSGKFVKLTVADDGAGMPPEVIDRAFEPFFTTKPMGAGTGLGLSMVYGFIKQSGGHIEVESQPTKGTAVTMYLPRAEIANSGHDDLGAGWVEEPFPKIALDQIPGGTETILVTEDSDQVRRVAVKILSLLGYRALAASDGAQALELLSSQPEIALLFTDIVLPGGLDGYQLAARARELRPDLKVLFCTGYSQEASSHEQTHDKAAPLIAKPYEPDELGRVVRLLLDKTKAKQKI